MATTGIATEHHPDHELTPAEPLGTVGVSDSRPRRGFPKTSWLVKSASDWLGLIGLIFVVLLMLLTASLLIRALVSY